MTEAVFHLADAEATTALGERIAPRLAAGEAVLLYGPLGMGKSTLARRLIRALTSPDEDVPSPTFTLVQFYETAAFPLAHFDLYRISTENDLCAAGFYDYLDQGAIVAAEWSENFADLLAPEDPIHINIDRVDDTTRRITIEGVSV